MGQRSVFGYFQELDQAKKAAEELKSKGYSMVSVDRILPVLGGKPEDRDEEIHGMLLHQGNSLTTTTLGSPPLDDDKRILASSHVDASGLAGGNGFSHPEDVCVTVITDDQGYKQAYKILENYGAR